MQARNTNQRYGWISIVFHWLMAALIIAMLALGLVMEDLEDPLRGQIYGLHKATGIVILFLALLRLIWRSTNARVAMPATMDLLKRRLAHVTHVALYVLMLCIPLSGWVMSDAAGYPVSVYGLFTMPSLAEKDKILREIAGETHELLAFGLMALLALHIAAALYHHVMVKDDVLRRMLPGKS